MKKSLFFGRPQARLGFLLGVVAIAAAVVFLSFPFIYDLVLDGIRKREGISGAAKAIGISYLAIVMLIMTGLVKAIFWHLQMADDERGTLPRMSPRL